MKNPAPLGTGLGKAWNVIEISLPGFDLGIGWISAAFDSSNVGDGIAGESFLVGSYEKELRLFCRVSGAKIKDKLIIDSDDNIVYCDGRAWVTQPGQDFLSPEESSGLLSQFPCLRVS